MENVNKCLYCDHKLRKLRINQDWFNRKYHLSCKKKMIETEQLFEHMQLFDEYYLLICEYNRENP